MNEELTLLATPPRDEFWDCLYDLRLKGHLCDIDLGVKNADGNMFIIHAHKLVLVASSAYFKQALESGELLEFYNFDGIRASDLEIVLDYVYHQKAWQEVEREPAALTAANALGIDRHSTKREKPSKLYKDHLGKNFMVVSMEGKPRKKAAMKPNTEETRIFIDDVNQVFEQSIEYSKSKANESAQDTGPQEQMLSIELTAEGETSLQSLLQPSEGSAQSQLSLLADASSSADTLSAIAGITGGHEMVQVITGDSGQTLEVIAGGGGRVVKEEEAAADEVEETVEETEEEVTVEAVDDPQGPDSSQATGSQVETAPQGSNRYGTRGKKFNLPEALKPEKKIKLESEAEEEEEQEEHKCPTCGRGFKNAQGLSVHMGWAHNASGVSHMVKPVHCPECNADVKGSSALSKHMRRYHNNADIHKCSQEGCEEKFSTIRSLRKHLGDVHSVSMFSCDICSISFKSPEGMKIHNSKFHTKGEASLTCHICGKSFKLKHELARHIKYTHNAGFDYKCNLCERGFKTRGTLKRHISTYHSKTRSFICDVCESAFKTAGDLSKHRSLHFRDVNPLNAGRKIQRSNPDGKELRPCKYCGKEFNRLATLTHHEYCVHEAKQEGITYVCSICNKSFAVQAYLQQHIQSKHRPKKYKCGTCEASFTQRYLLHRHMPRCKCIPKHLKPFHCTTCGATFLNKRNLQVHHEQNKCEKELEKQKQDQEDVDYVLYMKEEVEEEAGVEEGEVVVNDGVAHASAGEEGAEEAYQIVENEDGQFIQIGDKLVQVSVTMTSEEQEETTIIQHLDPSAEVAMETGLDNEQFVFRVIEDHALTEEVTQEILEIEPQGNQ
ncbi:hypothetical protein CAPTEDRAFT_225601 [Capitella teleta]|uniref:BTB domain-containing protein n=1 Tax=Capitella teleta TaxID=283909 RepID=R7UJW0_CAPTE|nr:hypothetical protein CAPTEDRAFT_225601 [Capitella teleta]|eukprot:ELU04073.1 hypothetical protein CAPTEDRAFT_225601 [Capitella teleta]